MFRSSLIAAMLIGSLCTDALAEPNPHVKEETEILHFTSVKDYGGARKVVDTLRKSDPDSHVGLLYDGLLHLWKGNPTDARIGRISIERDVQLHPKEGGSRIHLANVYINEGKFTQALSQAEEAARLMPTIASPYLVKAAAQIRLRQFEAALATNEMARGKNQFMPDLYNANKFICLAALGRDPAAHQVMAEAVKTKQFQDWVVMTAAIEALERQDNEAAARLAEGLLQWNAKQPENWKIALIASIRLNRPVKVQEYAKAYFKMRPRSHEHQDMANFYLVQRVPEMALKELARVVPSERTIEWYRFSHTAHKATMQLELALSDISYVIAHDQSSANPGRAANFVMRGDLYMLLGQPEKAIPDFTAAIKLTPHDKRLYEKRAAAYEDNGDEKGAAGDRRAAQSL